jgi:hypothetical protein
MDRQPLTDRLGDRLLAEYGGAAAAYSLRALNGNGDSVVRVRRASDNDEKDFTAEQIELGEMVNWVNSQTVPPLDIGVETSEGRIPVPEGGTSIGTPAAAYSLRNLSTTYTGNVVDVRRSIDDAVESFTAAEVADGTLEAWVLAPVSSFIGNKIYFDGEDDYIVIPHNSSLSIGTADLDITGSFKSFGTNDTLIAKYVTDDDSREFRVELDSAGRLAIVLSPDGSNTTRVQTSAAYNDGELHTFRVFKSGTECTFYIDGFELNTETVPSNIYEGSREMAIGVLYQVAPSFFFEGVIFDLSLSVDSLEVFTFDGTIADGNEIGTVNGSPELFTGQGVDGFVSKWYDQSGNDNHATQGTAASQPKIVDGGSLVSGGLEFDGVDDLLELSGSGLDIFKDVGYAQVFAVAKSSQTGTGSGRLILATTAGSAAARYVLADSPTNSASYRIAGRRLDSDPFQTVTSNSPHGNLEKILTGFLNYNDSEAYLYQNGTNVATDLNFQLAGNSSNTSSSLVEFGSNGFDGTIREIIVYPSDQSDNRTAIEANIGETYGITGIPAYDNTVDGFVETWYDQSGNGNDATQATAGNQPKIVDGGVFLGEVDFLNGVSTFLETNNSNLANLSELSLFSVLEPVTENVNEFAISAGSIVNSTGNYGGWALWANGFSDRLDFATQARGNATNSRAQLEITSTSPVVYSATLNGTDAQASLNGVLGTENTSMITPNNTDGVRRKLRLGCQYTFEPASFYSGAIKEVVLYTTDQSANRVAIETNINDHYNIY